MDQRQKTLNDKLIGRSVRVVNADAINVIHLWLDNGECVSIGADEHHFGIPIVQVEKWGDLCRSGKMV